MTIQIGDDSLWGEVQSVKDVAVLGTTHACFIETAGHGGIIIEAHSSIAQFLDPEAVKIATRSHGYLCFEEDRDYIIAIKEFVRLGFEVDWRSYNNNPDRWMELADAEIAKHYPKYALVTLTIEDIEHAIEKGAVKFEYEPRYDDILCCIGSNKTLLNEDSKTAGMDMEQFNRRFDSRAKAEMVKARLSTLWSNIASDCISIIRGR